MLNENYPAQENRNHSDNENIALFRPQPVSVETVILTVKSLKDSNAFGNDSFSSRFIKDALFEIAFYVTIIVNTSIVTGVNPFIWKYGQVAPYHKKGDVDDVSNYRPVTLLPVLSKVLEKIVAEQLMNYLELNKLLSSSQHGFRKSLSTETALMQVMEKLYHNMDNKKLSLITLCDLSKAFDSVSHDILINKCLQLKIDSFWFNDYLSNRTQSVRIGNHISSAINMTFGVPQGSILGPILFLIYVNDMKDIIKECLFVQYADDSQFIHTGEVSEIDDIIKRTEETLSNAKRYFLENGLMVNPKKTQFIFIGTRQIISQIPENVTINFDNESITPSKQVKNLGIYIDNELQFDIHINELCKKATGTLLYINRMSDRFDKETRTQIVQTLVLSMINYCLKIWGTTNRTQLQKVQKLQNFAARVAVGGVRKYDHITPTIRELQWLKIEQKCDYDICIMVFKILRNKLPSWLITLRTVSEMHSRYTRQRNHLFFDRTNTNVGSRSLTKRGPFLWNTLPEQIKDTNSLTLFKDRLKKFFLEQQ